MHKNHFSAAGKNEVGIARQIPPVEAVTIAHTMNKPTDKHFRPCIFAMHTSHGVLALFRSQIVGAITVAFSISHLIQSHKDAFREKLWAFIAGPG
jgi:hypothetical protein